VVLIVEFAPHILTALATNTLEAFRGVTLERDIRCALNWGLQTEKTMPIQDDGRYGCWEMIMILNRLSFVDS